MMMTNKKTNKWAVLKYMYLLPVGAFATVAFARPEVSNKIDGGLDQISAVTMAGLSATMKGKPAEGVHPAVQNEVKETGDFKVVTTKPQTVQAKKKKNDRVTASLTGKVDKVVVTASYNGPKSAKYVEFKKEMFKNDAEKAEFETVKDSAIRHLQAEKAKSHEPEVYTRVEEMPCYPGGAKAMMEFIAQNIRYPKACKEALVQGTVYCEFTVKTDGQVDTEHIRTFTTEVVDVTEPVRMELAKQLEGEAARIVKKMPRWTPGKVNGKPVDASYTIPVEFRLQ